MFFAYKSLRTKLFSIFLVIGVVPFITLLIYTLYLSETQILNKIIVQQRERTHDTKRLIQNHLGSLLKEVKFLSSLDIMDDIIAEDIDKRIARLLLQKEQDLAMNLSFEVFSSSGKVIASTQKKNITHPSIAQFTHNSGYYTKGTDLFFYSKIFASFTSKKLLGFIVLKYDLQNLTLYLSHQNDIHTYIIHSSTNAVIGNNLSLYIKFHNKEDVFIDDAHVIVYEKFDTFLDDWYLVYGVNKSVALEFLYDFIQFMLLMAAFILLFIIYVSKKYSKTIVQPIEKLTEVTNAIIQTNNYEKRIDTTTQDEIATLTLAFNKMLGTTSFALKKLEDKISQLQQTTSASNAKSAFISNMSHELRTPLNAIIGFTQSMIMYEKLSEKQIDTMGSIESSAEYLLGMINEILDIAKIEAGKMEVSPKEVDVLELTQNCYNMLSPLAFEKDLEFAFVTTNLTKKTYKTDPKLFQQIILNLISNAIKFTQKGEIVLEIFNDDATLFISIKDSGIGINASDILQLFNEFTQVENVMQKKHKGSGLGLSLSRKMARLLGGDVKLFSDGLGHGSTSIFSLHQY